MFFEALSPHKNRYTEVIGEEAMANAAVIPCQDWLILGKSDSLGST